MHSAIQRDEALALVTLARYVVRADGQITDAELRAMMGLARQVGLGVFSDALEKTDEVVMTRRQLMLVAQRIQRGEMRQWMHGVLVELASSDGLVEPEQELLEALADCWKLEWAA